MENLKSNIKSGALGLVLIVALTIISCNKKSNDIAQPVTVSKNDTGISYKLAIQPITDKYCKSCHFEHTYVKDLSNYAALKSKADDGELVNRLLTKKDMPPQGSVQPTQFELWLINQWIIDGCNE